MAFWLRVTGWRIGVAGVIALTSLIYLLQIGDRSWYVGVMGTVIVFALILTLTIYVVHYRSSMLRFRRMRIPESTFEPNEKTFRMTSDVGSTELSWNTITEVWCFPDFWLVFFSRAQFITLPTADLSGEVREFILNNIRSRGGKVS
jgi:hypothetical protein